MQLRNALGSNAVTCSKLQQENELVPEEEITAIPGHMYAVPQLMCYVLSFEVGLLQFPSSCRKNAAPASRNYRVAAARNVPESLFWLDVVL